MSGSRDRTDRLRDVGSGVRVRVFDGHRETIGSVHWSIDQRHVLSTGHDGTVRGLDPRNEERRALLRVNGISSSTVMARDGSTVSRETSAGHRPMPRGSAHLHFRRGPRKMRTACLFRSETESSTSGLTNACTGVAGPGGFKWRHCWWPPGDARLFGQDER